MKIYLVGGAVRDYLLLKMRIEEAELEEKAVLEAILPKYWENIEKDWVVVEATPAEMIAKGFKQVGKSFPVFLHPETQEEYALARTERKIGKGYTAFECNADPSVTLEDDLHRRDLTINAIAMPTDEEGHVIESFIDPYKGQQDLSDRKFKHISPAFLEDPVRILRVARLAARFTDFSVDEHTTELMQKMVRNGEVDALVPERVWQEFSRALKESQPLRFFKILEQSHALSVVFPEFINYDSLQAAMNIIVHLTQNERIRFSVLTHVLTTAQIKTLSQRLHINNDFRELALLVQQHLPNYQVFLDFNAEQMLDFLERTDALRRTDRFYEFLVACHAIEASKTPLGLLQKDSRENLLKEILQTIKNVDTIQLQEQGLQGLEFANALREMRLEKIRSRL